MTTTDAGRAEVAPSRDVLTQEEEVKLWQEAEASADDPVRPHLERTSAAEQEPDDAEVQEAMRHEARALYRLLLAPMIGSVRAD